MSSLSRGNASTIRLCLWPCSYHCYFGQLVILWFPLSTLCALYHSSWDLKISCSLQWKVLNLSSIFAIHFIHAVCIHWTLHLVDWEKERLNAACFAGIIISVIIIKALPHLCWGWLLEWYGLVGYLSWPSWRIPQQLIVFACLMHCLLHQQGLQKWWEMTSFSLILSVDMITCAYFQFKFWYRPFWLNYQIQWPVHPVLLSNG